jgi:hypothetical protein
MAIRNYFDLRGSSISSLAGSQDRFFEEMSIVFCWSWPLQLHTYFVWLSVWPVVWFIICFLSAQGKLEAGWQDPRSDLQWNVEEDQSVRFG